MCVRPSHGCVYWAEFGNVCVYMVWGDRREGEEEEMGRDSRQAGEGGKIRV